MKYTTSVKTTNTVNEPFEVIVNRVKILLVAKPVGNVQGSPCDFCDAHEFKTIHGGATPLNCHKVLPSCFANQRQDKTSVVYKRVK